MAELGGCPDAELLARLAAGTLDPALASGVGAHVARCAPCAAAVRRLRGEASPENGTIASQATVAPATESLGDHADADADAGAADDPPFDVAALEPSTHAGALGRLGKYDVLGVRGHGGMGVVLRAFDAQLGRPVAIKVLSPALASSAAARRRFQREARAAAAVNHPNVVTIHAVEEHRGQPFLVMELVNGRSLQERLRAEGRLEALEVIRLGAQVAAGLAAAHAQGVIHRDVKPANVMLEDGVGRAKLTDFGLARSTLGNAQLSSRNHIVGTPAYMAPEQLRGGNVDARADLFGLGCLLYAMATGHSPFRGRHTLEVAGKVAEHHPPRLHEVDPAVPEFLSDLVDRLLQKHPDDRYQAADEVAGVLQQYLAALNQAPSDQVQAILQGRLPGLRRRRVRRRPPARAVGVVLGGAFGAVALGAMAAKSWWRDTGVDPGGGASPALALALPADPAPRGAHTVTVAQAPGADCRTLGAALARVAPGGTVRVLDDAVYEEPVALNDAARWRDLRLVSERRATLAAPGSFTVLLLADTPGVVVRGFRIRQQPRQHAVVVTGRAAGVRVEDIACDVPAGAWAPVYITKQAAGTEERPLEVRDSTFTSQGLNGLTVQADEHGPVAHVRVHNNRFRGDAMHLHVIGPARDVAVTGNVFVGGVGVALSLRTAASRGVRVADNAFFRTRSWLDVRASIPGAPDVAVCDNLALESGAATSLSGAAAMTAFAQAWSFQRNRREPAGAEGPGPDPTAEVHTRIEVLSRDPEAAEFLRPVPPARPTPPSAP